MEKGRQPKVMRGGRAGYRKTFKNEIKALGKTVVISEIIKPCSPSFKNYLLSYVFMV
jgi:hypothetical protein